MKINPGLLPANRCDDCPALNLCHPLLKAIAGTAIKDEKPLSARECSDRILIASYLGEKLTKASSGTPFWTAGGIYGCAKDGFPPAFVKLNVTDEAITAYDPETGEEVKISAYLASILGLDNIME
ncbi:MAG TPA: hypothetical protein VLG37_01265 [Candidatus Saccharimonadales bacterium]|nr:hypothetical protein [Candidatus Saccharimonadales bacterium]